MTVKKSEITICYPPQNDGTLLISVKETQAYHSESEFNFTIAHRTGEDPWAALVRAAKGILNQQARRDGVKPPFPVFEV